MAVVLSSGTSGVVPSDACMTVSAEISADELWGRLAAVRDFRPQLRRMTDQVATMQRLGKKLNENLVEVDQELRLASRLQRDFLPQCFPEVNDIRFAAFFRPATWVSGDIYDVRRLDETRVGLFLADAMGHGVAAGLLTMFIKEAVVDKRIGRNDYHLVPPSEILEVLNNELANQDLPNCQFVTGCCAVIDTAIGELTFARGGHPHPVHVDAAGQCHQIETTGGLLGVFPDETFPSATLRLEPGEKLVFYSDGLEDMILARRSRDTDATVFTPEFLAAAGHPSQVCIDALAHCLDNVEGSLEQEDDQTCLIVEHLPA